MLVLTFFIYLPFARKQDQILSAQEHGENTEEIINEAEAK